MNPHDKQTLREVRKLVQELIRRDEMCAAGPAQLMLFRLTRVGPPAFCVRSFDLLHVSDCREQLAAGQRVTLAGTEYLLPGWPWQVPFWRPAEFVLGDDADNLRVLHRVRRTTEELLRVTKPLEGDALAALRDQLQQAGPATN